VTQKRAYAVKDPYKLNGNCGNGNGNLDGAPPGGGHGNCGSLDIEFPKIQEISKIKEVSKIKS
jgi:hypothetical protein